MMLKTLSHIADFFIPKLCIHCKAPIQQTCSCFCQNCQGNIQFIEQEEVCIWCSGKRDRKSLLCTPCHTRRVEKKMFCARVITTCTKGAELEALVSYFQQRRWIRFAKTIASMMAVRFLEDFDIPVDLITYAPRFFLRKWLDGFHPEKEVAHELAHILQRPAKALLGLYTSCPLTYEDVKVKMPLWNKAVLMVALEKNDGQELALYAKKLLDYGAYKVTIFTFI